MIVNSNGEFLGYHEGVHAYTIGQRRGIEVANGPWFVLEIYAAENKLVIGREEELARNNFKIDELNLLQDEIPEVVSIKIRAQHKFAQARVRVNGEHGLVETLQPVTAVSPGQICALYDGDKLLGGGTIVG